MSSSGARDLAALSTMIWLKRPKSNRSLLTETECVHGPKPKHQQQQINTHYFVVELSLRNHRSGLFFRELALNKGLSHQTQLPNRV